MKKTYQYIKRFLGILISIIFLYFILGFTLSIISTRPKAVNCSEKETIYIISNGIHLDIVLEKAHLNDGILSQLNSKKLSKYIAFGWGDKGFYLNTQKWADLKLTTALNAFFLRSETAMHVTMYS